MPIVRHILLAKAAIFLVAAGVTSVLFINGCDLLFDCGCRSWWNGAADSCNVHNSRPPHCPFCLVDGIGGYASFALIVCVQGLVTFRPSGLALWKRAASAFLAFPVVGGFCGLVLGWITRYWIH